MAEYWMNLCSRLSSYLFDIFLGPSYNQAPPNVKYMTVLFPYWSLSNCHWPEVQTNAGKFRFNPNLYAVRYLVIVHYLLAQMLASGRQSLSVSPRDLARSWLDSWKINLATSMWSSIIEVLRLLRFVYRSWFPYNLWFCARSHIWMSRDGQTMWEVQHRKLVRVTILLDASIIFTPPSDSANVRRMCVHTAVSFRLTFALTVWFPNHMQMLGNLKNPPEPFADVIQTHFRLKAKSISAQLDEWYKLDDGASTAGDGASVRRRGVVPGTSSNGFKKDIDELKALLSQIQTEEGPSNQ